VLGKSLNIDKGLNPKFGEWCLRCGHYVINAGGVGLAAPQNRHFH